MKYKVMEPVIIEGVAEVVSMAIMAVISMVILYSVYRLKAFGLVTSSFMEPTILNFIPVIESLEFKVMLYLISLFEVSFAFGVEED